MKEHKFFTIRELIKSETANKLNINNVPNDPEVLDNLDYTMDRLDEIRAAYGKPIIINSGFRCKALNNAVGGVKDSYHQSGLAVDIRWDSDLLNFLINNCQFDKLIREHSRTATWIHLQFKRERNEERNKIIYLNI